jgi:signal transduction histidine kinase/ABC-type nitrate/sulfonate/bicarbonate transport system substrate-binding protein
MRIIFLLVLFYSFCFSAQLEKVTLQLQWKHQFEFAGFYAAKELGYYEEEGLDVTFIEYDGKSSIVDSVVENKVDFGLTYASIIAEYLQNKPVMLIANYFKQSPLVLVAQKTIATPRDLRNKKIMGVSDSIDSITLQLMLEKFDISLNDVDTVATTFDIDDFINKKVDAMAVFTTNEIYKLDKLKIPYNLFNPSVYGMEYYDVNLFTTREFALNNPRTVKKFAQATNKGWAYALQNQAEIVRLILQKYDTQNKTDDELLFEAKQIKHLMLSSSEDIGSIDAKRIELIAKNFIEAGYVDQAVDVNLNDFIFGYEDTHADIIDLTPQEKQYLSEKKYISMCVDPDWEPYEVLDEKKRHKGLAADFIRTIESKIGKQIKVIPTTTWAQSVAFAKQKKCEILSFLNQTLEREEFLNFTPPLYEESEVIITRTDVGYVNGLNGLRGKSVAVVKGYKIDEILKRDYNEIQRVYVQNYEEALKKVANNEVFASINSLLGTAHLVKELGLLNVKIAGETKFYNVYKVGVVKDDPVLLSILSKAVANITQKEKDTVLANWVTVKFDTGLDYTLVWKISALFLVIVLLLVYRHYAIKQINQKLQKKMDEKLQEIVDKDRMIFHQSKLIAMGEMIENIAHQWRQPLSQINASVMAIDDILTHNKFNSKAVEDELDTIEHLTNYMSQTIDDFRNFCTYDEASNAFLLGETVDEIMALLAKHMQKNNIDVVVNIPQNLKIKGDASSFKQMLLILTNNAKDALQAGKNKNPQITLQARKENASIVFEVVDNGGGIDAKIEERIFEPYFSTKNKAVGTGLGLYIAKMLVQTKLHGTINAKNQGDKAVFTIVLKEENGG